MSQAQTRIGDKSTGHNPDQHWYPPHELLQGSPDVFINGKAAGRVGDQYDIHVCEVHGRPDEHESLISEGSSTVFINGKASGRVGDRISCDDLISEGSPDVFIGD